MLSNTLPGRPDDPSAQEESLSRCTAAESLGRWVDLLGDNPLLAGGLLTCLMDKGIESEGRNSSKFLLDLEKPMTDFH